MVGVVEVVDADNNGQLLGTMVVTGVNTDGDTSGCGVE